MTDTTALQALLEDAFQRARDLVVELTDGLSDEVGRYRPDPEANSIGWLLWHLTRVADDHVAELAGVPQAWPQWRERFDLPFDDDAIGYGQTSAEVGAVHASGESLAGYHADVHRLTNDYLQTLTDAELGRVIDTRWDPPVTVSARLVSVLGDVMQHLGQAGYVRGLAERRDQAWHTTSAADR